MTKAVKTKGLTLNQKKEWAQSLFIANELTQKEIAHKVAVSENTISKWVNEGNWNKLKRSLLNTKSEILRKLYIFLEKLSEKFEDESSIGDTKLADSYVKYTAAINNLETETNIGQISEVGRMFINHLKDIDPELTLRVLNEFDGFIKKKLKGI